MEPGSDTVPGVLVGGQIAPFLGIWGEFSHEDIERSAAALLVVVGVSFAVKSGTSSLVRAGTSSLLA